MLLGRGGWATYGTDMPADFACWMARSSALALRCTSVNANNAKAVVPVYAASSDSDGR